MNKVYVMKGKEDGNIGDLGKLSLVDAILIIMQE